MDAVIDSFLLGAPVLLAHFGTTVGLLLVGVAIYEAVTPYRELQLMREGNVAAGVALGGAVLAMAIPLAACMATSVSVPDILVWGALAIALQLATFGVVALVFRTLPQSIAEGNLGKAVFLAAIQNAVALINAAAISG